MLPEGLKVEYKLKEGVNRAKYLQGLRMGTLSRVERKIGVVNIEIGPDFLISFQDAGTVEAQAQEIRRQIKIEYLDHIELKFAEGYRPSIEEFERIIGILFDDAIKQERLFIDLDGIDLSEIAEFPQVLAFFSTANIAAITTIDLSTIGLADDDEEEEVGLCLNFLQSLAAKTNLSLECLSLSKHYLTSEEITAITEILGRVDIKKIDLSSTLSGGSERSELIAAIAANETLEYCSLAEVQIHDANFEAFYQLMLFSPVEVLDIRSTKLGWFTDPTMTELFLETIKGSSTSPTSINLSIRELIIDELTLQDMQGDDLSPDLAEAVHINNLVREYISQHTEFELEPLILKKVREQPFTKIEGSEIADLFEAEELEEYKIRAQRIAEEIITTQNLPRVPKSVTLEAGASQLYAGMQELQIGPR